VLILPDQAGPHDPLSVTPPRRPGSVRRTSSIDSTRPHGVGGNVCVDARARDLRTPRVADGASTGVGRGAVELDSAAVTATIDPARTLLAIAVEPSVDGIEDLVGATVGSGYRQRALDALPDDAAHRTLLNLIVDDMPGACLVSGVAVQRAHADAFAGPAIRQHILATADICAGWASDATILNTFREHDRMPVAIGPPAPTIERDDDPAGWHPMAELPPHATRRRRCLDLWPEPDAEESTHGFEAHFRDSYVDEEGDETVVHEYVVTGRIDAGRRTFTAVEAQARVLPWIECPGAVASAGRLVGTPIGDVRARVRATFIGQSTCTHLNDTLRMLADLEVLLDG
jgi:hypothetical protein